jgi:RNA-binding protein NOB1
MKTEFLVLDSAPIFKSASLLCELSSEFITVPEVLQEIKDQATRDAIARLPYKIVTKSPSEESLSFSIMLY